MKNKWKTKLENETRGSSSSYSSALKYFFYYEFIREVGSHFLSFPGLGGATLWIFIGTKPH